MKKTRIGICMGITIIVMALIIVCMIETFFTIFFASGVLLCNEEDKKFISKKANINEDFYIVLYNDGVHGYNKTAKVILKGKSIFPNIYGEEIIIEKNEGKSDGEICTYIRENSNSDYALFTCMLPYIIVIFIAIILLNKVLIPKFNNVEDKNFI